MTQEERWRQKYNEVKSFIETNHWNPARQNPKECFKYCNWLNLNKAGDNYYGSSYSNIDMVR